MPNLLLDGFKILAAMSIEELECRVDWLEKSLSVYKTLLIARKMVASRPEEFELPEEFQEFAPQVPATEKRTRDNATWPKIKAVLEANPQGMKVCDICTAIGSTEGRISSVLYYRKNKEVVQITYGVWKLKNFY